MKWDSQRISLLIEAARGNRMADLCVRNCKLVNVLSGRIETVDLAVHQGFVVGWGNYEAGQEIDAEGMYLCPGFIDGHIHIESTLLNPSQFCAAVLPWATTAVVADPHEIANVLGLPGITYLLQSTESIPLDFYFNLPSCVPASPLETNGAHLTALDLYSLLPHPRILGLAEVMNFPGVLGAVPEIMNKILLFHDRVIDGHAPMLSGLDLNAYIAAGIGSDHESSNLDEAREKLSKGMHLMIREGSQSKDLATLLPAVDNSTWPRCMFVSDDRHPQDLLRHGHMNHIVNHAMQLGMDPVRAITLATLTPSLYFGLSRQGAIAPGYKADFSLSPTLEPWIPQRVFKGGIEIATEGKLLVDPNMWPQCSLPESPIRITSLSPEDLLVPAQSGDLRVIGVQENTLLTRKILMPPKVEKGYAVIDKDRDLLKLAVYNRYLQDQSPAVAFAHGFGLRGGAIATTVAHDSHNLIAVGTSDYAILQVVDAVRKTRGGMAVGSDDGHVEILPLPVGGLMSDQPLSLVVERFDALQSTARALGTHLGNPLMALSFLSLAVIPELRLTDLGLVDVTSFSFVSLFEEGL